MTVYYLSREQAYNAMSSKADNIRVDQKADRKFVNAVFDYVNQKLNKLLGAVSSDELMQSIKKLEQQIDHQNELIKLERIRFVGYGAYYSAWLTILKTTKRTEYFKRIKRTGSSTKWFCQWGVS